MRRVPAALLIVSFSLVVSASSATAGATAAPSAPLGVVMLSENAHVGTDTAYSGATIYEGDRLQTPEGGNLQVRFGASQLYLRQRSTADVHAFTNGFSATLESGTVVATSAAGKTFQLIADGVAIRPASAQPTSVQITKISETELVITGNRGTAEVSMGDEVKTVDTGNSYRLEVQPEPPGPSAQPQFPSPTARNRFLWVLISVIAVATGIIVWRATLSPSAP